MATVELTLLYRLRPEVQTHQAGEGLVLACPLSGATLGWRSSRPAALLDGLGRAWLGQDEMARLFGADADWSLFYLFFLRMLAADLLELRVERGGQAVFEVCPAPGEELMAWPDDPAGATWRLSRFAYLRGQGQCLLLESPLTPRRVTVRDPSLLTLIHALAGGGQAAPADAAARAFLALLRGLGLAEAPQAHGPAADPLDQWEFHDLLFHARGSIGGHFYPLGGSYHMQGQTPSLPAVREPVSDQTVDLPRPEGPLAAMLDQPFSRVLAARRSRRQFSDQPLSLAELGALLHAAARVQELRQAPQRQDELSLRPHPSGGARHPLEIYPLVRSCQGLAAGAYHYDPLGHRLELVPTGPQALEPLMDDNPHQMEGPHPPQVSLYIAARLGRATWKYQAIAYRIVNQDLGCLYQTLYLAATALGLAPCAIGAVEAGRMGAALGLDWRSEPLVGLLTLGRPPQ